MGGEKSCQCCEVMEGKRQKDEKETIIVKDIVKPDIKNENQNANSIRRCSFGTIFGA